MRYGATPVFILGLSAVVAATASCADSLGTACRWGFDCPTGACAADGQCVTPASADAATTSDAGTAKDAEAEGSIPRPDAASDAGGCVPDRNGVITRAEVPLSAGLRARFRVASGASVSTAGATQPDGARRWDLSMALSGDHDVTLEAQALAGAWYQPKFAGATYAAKLSDGQDLLGAFEATDTSLLLRGVVSPSDGLTRTELVYSPSVTVLAFPLQQGVTFSTNAGVSGLASGVGSVYGERYESKVDAHGELVAPYGKLAVLRVATVLTRTVGVVVTVIRSYAFVSECFGTVATITSQPNESAAEFTTAAEVRRLSP